MEIFTQNWTSGKIGGRDEARQVAGDYRHNTGNNIVDRQVHCLRLIYYEPVDTIPDIGDYGHG